LKFSSDVSEIEYERSSTPAKRLGTRLRKLYTKDSEAKHKRTNQQLQLRRSVCSREHYILPEIIQQHDSARHIKSAPVLSASNEFSESGCKFGQKNPIFSIVPSLTSYVSTRMPRPAAKSAKANKQYFTRNSTTSTAVDSDYAGDRRSSHKTNNRYLSARGDYIYIMPLSQEMNAGYRLASEGRFTTARDLVPQCLDLVDTKTIRRFFR